MNIGIRTNRGERLQKSKNVGLTVDGVDTPYVSFDIFDTLVSRCIGKREDFFSAVERCAVINGSEWAQGYAKNRLEAEERAIRNFGSEGLRLCDIYHEMELLYPQGAISELMRYEVDAEVDHCFPNHKMVSLMESCAEKATVFLISDMYLPKDAVERILHSCGISGYKGLFVSSECGCNKISGKLFQKVAEEEGFSLRNLTHIGDNFSADYRVPLSLGSKAHLVCNGRIVSRPLVNAVKRRLGRSRGFTNYVDGIPLENECDGAEIIGKRVLGPLLFGMVFWLEEMATRLNLDSLLFLSRDGYVIEKAYRLVFPDGPCDYMFGSRRAMIVPMLWESPSLDDVVSSLGFAGVTSMGEFVDRLGLERSKVEARLSSFGLSFDSKIDLRTYGEGDDFSSFYEAIKEDVVANSRREFRLFDEYLHTLLEPGKRYGLIDIGWRGNMQRGLVHALKASGLSCEIEGLYTGYYPAYNRKEECGMHGFLFNDETSQETLDREQCYNNVYEALFFAPHGTALGYRKDEAGTIKPRLASFEYNQESADFFARLQDSALEYVRSARDRNFDQYAPFSSSTIVGIVERFGMSPTLAEARGIGSCTTDYQGTSECLVKARPLGYYLLHPTAFYPDIKTCWWKPGFFRYMFGGSVNYGECFYRFKRLIRGEGFDGWGSFLKKRAKDDAE